MMLIAQGIIFSINMRSSVKIALRVSGEVGLIF